MKVRSILLRNTNWNRKKILLSISELGSKRRRKGNKKLNKKMSFTEIISIALMCLWLYFFFIHFRTGTNCSIIVPRAALFESNFGFKNTCFFLHLHNATCFKLQHYWGWKEAYQNHFYLRESREVEELYILLNHKIKKRKNDLKLCIWKVVNLSNINRKFYLKCLLYRLDL